MFETRRYVFQNCHEEYLQFNGTLVFTYQMNIIAPKIMFDRAYKRFIAQTVCFMTKPSKQKIE